MERVIEFPHAHMDRPRKRPRLGWDVALQALKICGRSDAKAQELLASFCDNILKKGGNEKLNDETIEDTSDKVVKLLAYVSDKDLYAEFYSDANEESKSVTKASSMKAIQKRMEKDVDEVGKITRNVKAKLEAISKYLANRQKPGCGKGTGVDRSRTNMTNAFTKKFRDLMIEFQTLR
ncbi:unnamed protein product [Camellia sinensis]